MTEPFVGLPTEGTGCAYSPALDAPACGARPTVHLAVETPGWGIVALSSCDQHAGVGRASGVLLDEHDYRAPCAAAACWVVTDGDSRG